MREKFTSGKMLKERALTEEMGAFKSFRNAKRMANKRYRHIAKRLIMQGDYDSVPQVRVRNKDISYNLLTQIE